MYLAVSALALAGLDVRTRLVDTLCDGRHLAVEHSEGLLQRSFESVFVLVYYSKQTEYLLHRERFVEPSEPRLCPPLQFHYGPVHGLYGTVALAVSAYLRTRATHELKGQRGSRKTTCLWHLSDAARSPETSGVMDCRPFASVVSWSDVSTRVRVRSAPTASSSSTIIWESASTAWLRVLSCSCTDPISFFTASAFCIFSFTCLMRVDQIFIGRKAIVRVRIGKDLKNP